MPLNLYCTLDQLKAMADDTPDQTDDVLLDLIEDTSRAIDRVCDRIFYVEIDTKNYDHARHQTAIDDLLSIFTVKLDTDFDKIADELVPETNFQLKPYNGFPKRGLIIGIQDAVTKIDSGAGPVEIDAVWGHGRSVEPWLVVDSETVTVADATITALTVDDSSKFEIGANYRIEGIGLNRDEYFFVDDIPDGVTLTVQRGINGSTAAAHAGAAVFRFQIETTVKRLTIFNVIRRSENEGTPDREEEQIGNYRYIRGSDTDSDFDDIFNKDEINKLSRLKRMRGVTK